MEDEIRCPETYWAPVDEISKLKQLFFTGDRKLRVGELVLFQPDIRITYTKSRKQRKVTRFLDRKGKQVAQCRRQPVLDAFVHYTYSITEGRLVACGFEGVVDDEGFSLISPVIHSKDGIYGDGDLGEEGIRAVFSNHVCNSLCHGLASPSSFNQGVPNPQQQAANSNSNILSSPSPSAPMSPADDVEIVKEGFDIDVGDSLSMLSSYHQDSTDANSPSACKLSSIFTTKTSEYTESMTAYVEPSAPDLEECVSGNPIFPGALPIMPPAYTQRAEDHVTRWLITEEASNSFLLPCLPPNTQGMPSLPVSLMQRQQQHPQQHQQQQSHHLASPTVASSSPCSSDFAQTSSGGAVVHADIRNCNGERRSSDVNANFLPLRRSTSDTPPFSFAASPPDKGTGQSSMHTHTQHNHHHHHPHHLMPMARRHDDVSVSERHQMRTTRTNSSVSRGSSSSRGLSEPSTMAARSDITMATRNSGTGSSNCSSSNNNDSRNRPFLPPSPSSPHSGTAAHLGIHTMSSSERHVFMDNDHLRNSRPVLLVVTGDNDNRNHPSSVAFFRHEHPPSYDESVSNSYLNDTLDINPQEGRFLASTQMSIDY